MFGGLRAIIYKELLQVRRDPASLVLALVYPVVELLLFGFAIATDVRHIPMVVIDRSHTRMSQYFVDALKNTDVLEPKQYVEDPEELFRLIRSGQASVGVIIPDDFSDRLVNGEVAMVQIFIDGSDSTVSNQALNTALHSATWLTELFRANHPEGQAGNLPTIEVRPRLLYNPDQRSPMFFVPGLAAILLQLITMILTAFSIVRERERGTLEQLLVTPISRLGLLLGKILPFLLIGSIVTVVIMLGMVFVFQVPIRGSLLLLAGLTMIYLLCSLSMGLFISTVAKTQLQSMLMAMMVLLPAFLLSGFMFPRASMPKPIYYLSFAFPPTYFVPIMRGIVLRGAGFWELIDQTLPLMGLTLAFLLLGLFRFQKRIA